MPGSALDRTFLSFNGNGSGQGTARQEDSVSRRTVFCFAHAGGTAATFAPWSRFMRNGMDSPAMEVVGIELPGHGTRMAEDLLEDVLPLATAIALSVANRMATTGSSTYAFYGHSLGAVIAYETARRLAETGAGGPSHLFVGAARAPHLAPVLPRVSHLDEQPFLEAVQQRYGGIPAAVLEEPELLAMVLPIMQADFAAYESYRYQKCPLLTCPITAFAGREDPVVQMHDVDGWADHTTGPFQRIAVPGDHFFLATSRGQVLEALRSSFVENAEESSRHRSTAGIP